MVGMRATDVVRGVDLLAARNDVDPSRIAVVGRGAAGVPALFAVLFELSIRQPSPYIGIFRRPARMAAVTSRRLEGNARTSTRRGRSTVITGV